MTELSAKSNTGDAKQFLVRLERPDRIYSFLAAADEYLLYAMIDAGIDSPYICEQGWCIACAARLLAGSVDRSGALTVYPEDVEAGFLLLCSTMPRSDLILSQDERQTRRDMMQHRIEHNCLARAYPPGARSRFRRGRAAAHVDTRDDHSS
ncbi:2Fe-2S iron-sulfur cluster binding domain-containing protein [Bradyrhizobium sp. SRS-191]|uniref:2Fe-2S iron-sulfur cluster binding domain-containing protein n=1 Tax=Bradyrhizobium sp. SRS-191 TaxID=2962606 RepID=UPI00211E3D2C|nr:2Fe-2S iron-sulfur cluster binding domain-containing protein [Bradyrhizobium sp. SRS-191]